MVIGVQASTPMVSSSAPRSAAVSWLVQRDSPRIEIGIKDNVSLKGSKPDPTNLRSELIGV